MKIAAKSRHHKTGDGWKSAPQRYTRCLRTSVAVLTCCLVFLGAVFAEEQQNVLTAAEKTAGWVLLFDGKTMNHWQDPAKLNPPGDAWTIEDGCLKAVAKPRIDEELVSTETYEDFELQWDWRILPGGNSGVKYRVQAFPVLTHATVPPGATKFEAKANYAVEHHFFDRSLIPSTGKAQIYVVGFEYQMLDNSRNPDAKVGGIHQAGALYDILAPVKDATKPPGQFNHSRLVVRGDHFEHWLNGDKVIDITVNPEMLQRGLTRRWGADSPVAHLLSLQPKKDCPITLQNHNDEAWFRNIKIRKL